MDDLTETRVLQWLFDRNFFATLLTLESESGKIHTSAKHANENLLVREMCVSGNFAKLLEVFANSPTSCQSVHIQQLMERLASLHDSSSTKQSVVEYLQLFKSVVLPRKTSNLLEDALLNGISGNPLFQNWSVFKGRYELYRSLAPVDAEPVVFSTPKSVQNTPTKSVLVTRYRDEGGHPIRVATFNKTGDRIAIGTNSQSLIIANEGLEIVSKNERIHSGSVYTAVWSPDGHWIATGSNDQTVRFNSVGNLATSSRILLQSGTVRSLSYLGDDSLVAGCSADTSIRCIDISTQKISLLSPPVEAGGHVNSVFASLGGILFATSNGAVCLMDVKSSSSIFQIQPTGMGAVASMLNNSVCVGSESGDIAVYDVRKPGTPVWMSESAHTASCRSVAFANGLPLLASASFDKTVAILNSSTGEKLHTFSGQHTDRVVHVAWSPSDALVSCGADATAILWNVKALALH